MPFGSNSAATKRSKQPFGAMSSRTSGQGAIPAVHAMCRQRPLWPNCRPPASISEGLLYPAQRSVADE